MLNIVALGLLPTFAVGQVVIASALCLPSGYEWVGSFLSSLSDQTWISICQMFNSLNESPCDMAASLLQPCYSGSKYVHFFLVCDSMFHALVGIDVMPLVTGSYYSGPYYGYDTVCMCNSVYYSVLSACGYCQGHGYLRWIHYTPEFSCNIPALVGAHTYITAPAYASIIKCKFHKSTSCNLFLKFLSQLSRCHSNWFASPTLGLYGCCGTCPFPFPSKLTFNKRLINRPAITLMWRELDWWALTQHLQQVSNRVFLLPPLFRALLLVLHQLLTRPISRNRLRQSSEELEGG